MSREKMPEGKINADGSITSAYVQRNFKKVRSMAKRGPVEVTIHGRAEMVILSRDTYSTLLENSPTAG